MWTNMWPRGNPDNIRLLCADYGSQPWKMVKCHRADEIRVAKMFQGELVSPNIFRREPPYRLYDSSDMH